MTHETAERVDETATASEQPTGESMLALIDNEEAASALEHILATGDLLQLRPSQRVAYYRQLCARLGLNSLGRPFDWLMLDDGKGGEKLTLYPNKSCAEQLRARYRISIKILRCEPVGELFVCQVEGRMPDGRTDVATKYVPVTGYNSRTGQTYRLSGERLSNAYAKAETGAKRRVTFSMIGLAAAAEAEDAEHVRVVTVDAHGNVLENPTPEQRYVAENPRAARVIGEPTFETTAHPDDAPLSGSSQAPADADLEPPRRTVPRQSFRPDDEEIARRVGAFFAMIRDTSFDRQAKRHAFVRQLGASRGWPPRKCTDNARTLFARASEDEAASMLNEVRQETDREKALRTGEVTFADHDDDPSDVNQDTGSELEPF